MQSAEKGMFTVIVMTVMETVMIMMTMIMLCLGWLVIWSNDDGDYSGVDGDLMLIVVRMMMIVTITMVTRT